MRNFCLISSQIVGFAFFWNIISHPKKGGYSHNKDGNHIALYFWSFRAKSQTVGARH
ncbi:MAG: hypothetical protein LIO54_08600 [Oscillospiraceae bacterium]|nr:hypothetical protein [Oscillospiraceae bacterium]